MGIGSVQERKRLQHVWIAWNASNRTLPHTHTHNDNLGIQNMQFPHRLTFYTEIIFHITFRLRFHVHWSIYSHVYWNLVKLNWEKKNAVKMMIVWLECLNYIHHCKLPENERFIHKAQNKNHRSIFTILSSCSQVYLWNFHILFIHSFMLSWSGDSSQIDNNMLTMAIQQCFSLAHCVCTVCCKIFKVPLDGCYFDESHGGKKCDCVAVYFFLFFLIFYVVIINALWKSIWKN